LFFFFLIKGVALFSHVDVMLLWRFLRFGYKILIVLFFFFGRGLIFCWFLCFRAAKIPGDGDNKWSAKTDRP